MQLTGHIKRIGATDYVNENFCKRSVIIETSEKYPQTFEIELLKDRVDLIEPYEEGEQIIIHVNLRGREWKSPKSELMYFTTLVGWKLERVANQSKTEATPTFQGQNEEDDDLPF